MPLLRHAIPAGYASHCPLLQQKKSCLPIHVAQKITVIPAENRKIRGLKFDTLYWRHLAAYRKKLNIGAQLHIILYKKPPKHF